MYSFPCFLLLSGTDSRYVRRTRMAEDNIRDPKSPVLKRSYVQYMRLIPPFITGLLPAVHNLNTRERSERAQQLRKPCSMVPGHPATPCIPTISTRILQRGIALRGISVISRPASFLSFVAYTGVNAAHSMNNAFIVRVVTRDRSPFMEMGSCNKVGFRGVY